MEATQELRTPGSIQPIYSGTNKVNSSIKDIPSINKWSIHSILKIEASYASKAFNITVIQVYAPTINAKAAEVEEFYENLQDLLQVTPTKEVFFIIGSWDEKVGSQEILE